jgi:hypothetical protein
MTSILKSLKPTNIGASRQSLSNEAFGHDYTD